MPRAKRDNERLVDLVSLGVTVSRTRATAGTSRIFKILPFSVPEHVDDEPTIPGGIDLEVELALARLGA
ncbi:MAG: hypothetical protein KF773_10640 [Deltaproteobacteria bacterium]|nr:hypothetical protein [Deltaproteobacteria bacterium]MCW5802505.1 hypothetical protein [Deltaproteobacteria bacterium]